jgi:quercetin dioxygenase-like cupin family protein
MRVISPKQTEWEPADPHTFVGKARVKRAAADQNAVPVVVYHVEFADGARTNWHTHSGPQWLFVVEGSIRVQKAGSAPADVAAGGIILIEPGDRHWHGAVPGSRGCHVAVNVDLTTTWLQAVSDAEYAGRS